jgi:two-component system response regulator
MKNKKRILLIDDEKDIAELVVEILKDEYDVEFVLSGKAALGVLSKDRNFDLILLDIIMPEMDGWEFLDNLKEILKDEKIPIAIFSILKEPQDMLKAIKEGACAYLVKPFEPSGLKKRIDEIFEKIG